MSKSTNLEKDILAETAPPYGSAWRAAEAQGIDMSLLEESLQRTPWERIQAHQSALALVRALQKAKIRSHA